jgi:DNA-directed RNA polymerase subunit RPC12/RpoP
MQNRHSKPTAKAPERCPKCSGKIIEYPFPSYSGFSVRGYKCVNCGLNSESESYVDLIKGKVVEI